MRARLPSLYARWIDEALLADLPVESGATCGACAMCEPMMEADLRFHPGVKCCTHTPAVPSFIAGLILADRDPEMAHGRASLLARIEDRVAVTPLGVGRPPRFLERWKEGRIDFGREEELRCPHYDTTAGRCGIWRHRESTCATWFCKHGRGARGRSTWQAVQRLLAAIEQTLARWCLLDLDLGPRALEILFPPPGVDDGSLDPDEIQRARHPLVWGRWVGREAELYVDCAKKVEALRFPQILAIGGPELSVDLALLRASLARLGSGELPERLSLATIEIQPIDEHTRSVIGYSLYDPLPLAKAVVDELPALDGATLDQALARLDRETLQKLLDFEILKPGEPA